ncbi:NeuD/PglB/VioB family sugar acetyltransferase [Aureitalea sp. L0-47]|uniref:NeuD/PglB/VioB family sugar acetyltransferase n=1 Tax=Aureitalea sp. L0-47 TaxID=2816962 RepID=UPI0022379AE5|nr:NeuD/PglB/VioB family sugar acetyltransferase [Aureitalea sp. L0-47]MCW5520387.1 NeuD/PglB/VioB family sugar acetyltransferase [Aureitalea sp. L0-47]
MKDIIIIGAGGFGREVKELINDINREESIYRIIGFVDDGVEKGTIINGSPVLGGVDVLRKGYTNAALALAIGDPGTKKRVVNKLREFDFPVLKHPNVSLNGANISVGKGCILSNATILTCDIVLGEFVTLNLACTIGHDVTIKNFCSFMPAVNISGQVEIEECVYAGTGVKIINNLSIGENVILGAGAVVTKSIPANTTAVGMPAKPLNR